LQKESFLSILYKKLKFTHGHIIIMARPGGVKIADLLRGVALNQVDILRLFG